MTADAALKEIANALGAPGAKPADVVTAARETARTIDILRQQLTKALEGKYTRLDAVARQGSHGDVAR